MNRPELYEKSINTLKDAYFNHTLKHGDCAYCAVGNLCREASEITGIPNSKWGIIFVTLSFKGVTKQLIAPEGQVNTYAHALLGGFQQNPEEREIAETLISATGYTIPELAKIERSFEMADRGDSEEDYMFNGLMAVVDALDEIHENNDAVITNTQKLKFSCM